MLTDRLLDGRLKVRHLILVTTVADHGSVVAAAKALHVTQPVVTRGVREVEQILGVDLFERGPRGMRETVFGSTFLIYARGVINQLREAGDQIDLLHRAEAGRVRIGTHVAGANTVLPHAIAALKQDRPRLTVEVQEGTPDLLYDALLSGTCDVVVGRLRAELPEPLRQELLYQESVDLVTRADHPAQQLHRPRLRMLADYPWILPVGQTALRAELEAAFVNEDAELPANRIECSSVLIVRALLHETDMIAALPRLIVADDGRLRPLQVRLRTISRAVGFTVSDATPLPPAAAALCDQLRISARALTE